MEFKDLLSFYFERSNAANGLWGFYITVVLGLLAYFGTAAPSRQKVMLAILVSAGFIGFAKVNSDAILEVARARHAVAKLMTSDRDTDLADQHAPDALSELRKTVDPSSISGIKYFHVASDILVVTGIWVLTLYKR